jgi:hypothetical protein
MSLSRIFKNLVFLSYGKQILKIVFSDTTTALLLYKRNQMNFIVLY